MAKVDFRAVPVKDIEGNVQNIDISKTLGNQLYMQGKDIVECELGQNIYNQGEVELTDEQTEIVRKAVAGYVYVVRSGIEEALKGENCG